MSFACSLACCSKGSRALKQIVTKFVPYNVQLAADEEMERKLAAAYEEAKALVACNRDALDRWVGPLPLGRVQGRGGGGWVGQTPSGTMNQRGGKLVTR